MIAGLTQRGVLMRQRPIPPHNAHASEESGRPTGHGCDRRTSTSRWGHDSDSSCGNHLRVPVRRATQQPGGDAHHGPVRTATRGEGVAYVDRRTITRGLGISAIAHKGDPRSRATEPARGDLVSAHGVQSDGVGEEPLREENRPRRPARRRHVRKPMAMSTPMNTTYSRPSRNITVPVMRGETPVGCVPGLHESTFPTSVQDRPSAARVRRGRNQSGIRPSSVRSRNLPFGGGLRRQDHLGLPPVRRRRLSARPDALEQRLQRGGNDCSSSSARPQRRRRVR